MLYRKSMNEHIEHSQESLFSKGTLKKFGKGALYAAGFAGVVVGVALGADLGLESLQSVDFGPDLHLDQGDSVLELK